MRYTSSYYSKSESMLRVVRVQLDNGERIVGIRYPSILIPEVEKVLKDQQAMESYKPSQVICTRVTYKIEWRVNWTKLC